MQKGKEMTKKERKRKISLPRLAEAGMAFRFNSVLFTPPSAHLAPWPVTFLTVWLQRSPRQPPCRWWAPAEAGGELGPGVGGEWSPGGLGWGPGAPPQGSCVLAPAEGLFPSSLGQGGCGCSCPLQSCGPMESLVTLVIHLPSLPAPWRLAGKSSS